MSLTCWRKMRIWKGKAGEIRGYYESTGKRYKFLFYPADGRRKQIKVLNGDGEVRFEVPSLNQYMSLTMTKLNKETVYA